MDECPSGLRSTPRKRVRVTPSASSNLASSASRVSSDWLETLFCLRLCIFCMRLFLFARYCFQNRQIRKQSRENVLAFVSFCPHLLSYLLKKGTNAG